MKNKKGFTLIEITLSVLLLALITLIAVPAIRTVISKSNEKAYNISVNTIEEAAKNYHYMNESSLKSSLDTLGVAVITMAELKEQGFIKDDIEDPRDHSIMNGNVEVRKVSENVYEYVYIDS